MTIGLDGDQITVGVVEAEQEISFTGTVSGDEMSGAWDNHGDCPPPRTRHMGGSTYQRVADQP